MKKLEKEFKSRGFHHYQLKRTAARAIYLRHSIGTSPEDAHYEVIRIGSHTGYNLGKSYIKATETYPSASMWGTAAWTCDRLESAEKKYVELGKYVN
jgi:hypothetical protein